jgi:hypothetical protein
MNSIKKLLINESGKPNYAFLAKINKPFKKGYFNFKKFSKALGIKQTIGAFKTPIGSVFVKPKSQFFKMKFCKDNRLFLSGLYVETLKNPALICKSENSYKYFGFYRGEKGVFAHIVAAEDINGEIYIKTNFPMNSSYEYNRHLELVDLQKVYVRDDIIAHLQANAEMAQTEEPKSDIVIAKIITNFDSKVNENL